ncbi:serine hydrolase domain-containing protein [Parvularcula marina]|nr:serine hydrolase domain-containing protein [Parvularcula marina]
MITRFGLAAALMLTACSGGDEPAGTADPATEMASDGIVQPDVVDAALADMVADGRVAGVAALIFEDGEEVFFGAHGMADREAEKPMARDTVVQIFSMTKPVAGVALMTLYEEGKFALDDPITKYVPELSDMAVYSGVDEEGNLLTEPARRQPIVMDFLRHTAGFIGDANETPLGQAYAAANPLNWEGTLADEAEALGKLPLLYHPGEQWEYSLAVDIQALMVERLSGMAFENYIQQTVLDPLGMTETAYYVPEERRDRMAAMYITEEDGSLTRQPDEQAYAFNYNKWPLRPGTFGLTSTLDDYAKFTRMLLNDGAFGDVKILEPETVKLMRTNYLDEEITERLWLPSKGQVGFGIDFAVRTAPPVDENENYGFVGEYFWDGYASTMFWVDPENDLTAVFFVQSIPFNGEVHKLYRDAVYNVRNKGIVD